MRPTDKRHKCMIYVRSAVIKVFHVLLLQEKKRMRIVSRLLFQLESFLRQCRLIFRANIFGSKWTGMSRAGYGYSIALGYQPQ